MKATLFLFALISSCIVFADTTSHVATTAAATQTAQSGATHANQQVISKPSVINVECVYKYHSSQKCDPTKKEIHPGDFIIVKFSRDDLDSAKQHLNDYRLWINGICFPNMKPHFIDEDAPGIIFRIERDTAHNSPWQLLYTNPTYWHFDHDLSVKLGTVKTEYQPKKPINSVHFYSSNIWMPWVFYPLFVILLILTIRYGKALLKDTSYYISNGVNITYTPAQPTNADAGIVNINDVPYSLSRFQFMVWLIIVFFAILHIWIITDVLTSPTGSVLLLIGISSGTFYISKLIDKSPASDTPVDPQTVTAFIKSKQKTQGLFYDMISDGNSISLHRLQLVLFTVFLAIYFVLEVINTLIMPQFDQTMLTLMGISNVTYAGIKTTEQ